MLDKGQEDNWFHSHLISTLAVVFPVALVLFVIWELTRAKPVMDLRMFKNRNFAGAAAMMFVLGIQSYAFTVFVPQYVQAFMGYTAELAGMTQAPAALAMLVLMPTVGKLVRWIDARWLIGVGFLLSALAAYHLTNIDLQIDFGTAAAYKFWQNLGLALLFIPINTTSYVGVPEEKGGEVSGTINLLRNLGGSIGISVLVATLAQNTQVVHSRLVEGLRPDNPLAQAPYLAAPFSLATPGGIAALNAEVTRQAAIVAYIDDFKLMMLIALASIPLLLLLREARHRPSPRAATATAAADG